MHAFWTWWQQLPQNFDAIAFFVGSLPVYWYALFFLAGALCIYRLAGNEYGKRGMFSRTQYKDFAFGVFLSVLVGGKLGFLFLYWYPFVFQFGNPTFLLPTTGGLALPGMSFVGGMIAVALYILWFAKKYNKEFFKLTDVLAIYIPLAILLGRLGNFFHLELKGRVTEMTWGMYFPGETMLRHPSTLYATFLEGVLLFIILFLLKKKNTPGVLTGCFLILYGLLRFLSELFREPDIQIGYIGMLTLNQIFALGIFVVGIVVFSIQNAKK